jgi:poly(3-hydroxybutyrate) depolymerase
VTGAAAVLASLALLAAGTVAGTARGDEVPFRPLPGFSKAVGAFLVAGPFEKALPSLETGAPATEGNAIEGDPAGGAGGRTWRLVVAPTRGQGVRLGEFGEEGYLYAQVALPLAEGANRYAVFAASTGVTFWVSAPGSPPLRREVAAYRRGAARLPRGRGHATLTLRFALEGAPAEVAVLFGGVGADGRLAPVPAAVRLADPSEERLAGLLAEAFSVTLTPELAGENARIDAELALDRAAPVTAGGLSVAFAVRPAGALVEVEQRSGPLGDLSARPLARATYRVPEGGPGSFEVQALVSRDGAPLAKVAATGLVAEEIERLVDGIDERARPLLGTPGAPESSLAYALLQAAKVRLALERAGGGLGGGSLVRDISGAEEALAAALEGRDFQAGRTGFMERAYFSEVDESPQPYLVYIPRGCRKGTGPWPLIVYYHGYVPTYDIDEWVGEYPLLNAVCEAEGCILAVPFARSNTDFLTVGEDDCLRVADEMARAYPVDPKRVYLYGYSMGGLGVWTTLCHYPDRFAAATVLSGQADMYLWHGVPRGRYEPWKRFLIDCDNPLGLAANMAHVPVRAYHGGADFVVPKEHSRGMVRALKALGGDAELQVVPDGTHWSLYSAVLFKREPIAWMKRFSLPDAPPAKFTITSHSPRYSRGWGLDVTAHRREVEPVEVTVTREGGKVTVETRNVAAMRIAGLLFKVGTSFDIRAADGGEFRVRRAGDGAGLEAALPGYEKLPPVRKRPGLSGPVKDALRSPFVVVYGTGGATVADRAEQRATGERFAKEWRDFAKGRPPVMADSEVTPAVEHAKTLVLLGEPATNSVIRRIARGLPVTWNARSAEVAGRRVALANARTGKARGLLFCHPNPDAPGRMVVVMSGLFWGGGLSINHKLDRVPDLILYEDEKDLLNTNDPHNKAVVAGFFGPDWRVETGRFFVDDAAPGVDPAK